MKIKIHNILQTRDWGESHVHTTITPSKLQDTVAEKLSCTLHRSEYV